jgi:hypothetical protein
VTSLVAGISLSLSSFSSVHSGSRCSVVWSLGPQGNLGESIILNLSRHVLMLPWPVSIVVRFWVMFILVFSLSVTSGK